MFNHIKENFLNLVTSRLFVLVIGFILLCAILIQRVFTLQIVDGAAYFNEFKLKIKKERSIPSTRGNIYDRNGKLLAYNELAYSVTIEDVYDSGKNKNANLNQTLRKLIGYIEKNGDKITNDFNIYLDVDNEFQFSVSDKQLLRFLADVYGKAKTDDLEYKESTATPDEVIAYLAGTKRYEIGTYEDPDSKKNFILGDGYTKEELLKVLTIRYAMSANSYQKYIPTVVATDVCEETVAVVMENAAELDGVSIAEDTIRKYVDSVYFSQIIGYTGKISTEELTNLSRKSMLMKAGMPFAEIAKLDDESLAQAYKDYGLDKSEDSNSSYGMTNIVGKSGIEQYMELELQGTKGSETVYVDNLGKVIETSERIDPTAGNNLYLTIDSDLQKAVYNILEQKIAGILYLKIRNIKEYDAPANASASSIVTPIYDVYFALINNNIIDISHFSENTATDTEQAVYASFLQYQDAVLERLRNELLEVRTPYDQLTPEYQVYESYIVSMLSANSKGILVESRIDAEDLVHLAWKKDETISLYEYLNHAIAMNWLDVTKIGLSSQYADSEEIYSQLLEYIIENLEYNTEFAKKMYKYMIKSDIISGSQICKLLCEQGIIEISEEEERRLYEGSVSAYNFMLERILNLDITPAQLALDPCSGSSVVTDVDTGEVLALVTYPGYDNNKLANSIDADYYSALQNDLAKPLWNYATQQRSAPGSTFKMVSAVAGLEEGVVNPVERITCLGTFEKINLPYPRCWIWKSGTHGPLDISGAIEHSGNYYFYELGYRLGLQGSSYNSDKGLETLAKYADMFGLSETSGIEIEESKPQVSDFDSVRSAIGQGTHNYTTAGLARYVTTVANSGTCFNLSLLDKLTDSGNNLLEDYVPSVRNQIEIPQTSWNAIHSGMRQVVERKKYYENLGVNVAGKTGTAQENTKRPNHALFVGYAPYENPEIAIATRIAFGYTSDYAAEISRDVIKYYYGLEDNGAILTGTADTPDAVGTGGD